MVSALAFWTEARAERIEALNAYLEKQRIRREKRQRGISPVSDSDDDNPLLLPVNHNEEEEDVEAEEVEEVEEVVDGLNEEEEDDENLSDTIPEMNEFERYLRHSAEQPLDDYQEHEASDSQMEPQPSTSREFKPFIGPGKNIIKNRGVVKVVKSTRRKNVSKHQRIGIKKKPTGRQNLETETSDLLDNPDPMYDNFTPLEVDESEVEDGEFITDEIHEEERSIKREYTSSDKILQKKEKREVKMKEISEQLRKMSGINQEEEDEEELII